MKRARSPSDGTKIKADDVLSEEEKQKSAELEARVATSNKRLLAERDPARAEELRRELTAARQALDRRRMVARSSASSPTASSGACPFERSATGKAGGCSNATRSSMHLRSASCTPSAVGPCELRSTSCSPSEIRALGELYAAERSNVSTGAAAREDVFKREASRYRVLHVATHGVFDQHAPMDSGLALASSEGDREDGLLEARALLGMTLAAEVVVLSACDMARGRITSGEGVIGMSWAAGSRCFTPTYKSATESLDTRAAAAVARVHARARA